MVHRRGMEDEPSSTFANLPLMLQKLGLSSEETDGGEEEEVVSYESRSWREADTEALRKEVEEEPAPPPEESTATSWRDSPISSPQAATVDLNKPTLDDNLSYEERAALRRAERQRKKREREALATAK